MNNQNALVGRLKQGDVLAFQQLVTDYSRGMYRAAYGVLHNQGLAEDCVQEALIKAHNKLDSFGERAKLATWLHRITINTAIDISRKQNKYRHETDDDLEVIPAEEWQGPETSIWQDEIKGSVEKALKQLSEDTRVAFMLRHYQGHSIQEISEMLGLNPNTVKGRIFRAVERLRDLLQSNMIEESC